MDGCIFCAIGSKAIASRVVYEDDATLGFLDIHPIAPGHAIVIPKAHASSILELPEEALGPVFRAIQKVTGILKASLNPDGFTIGINHGSLAGQAVDHLHIHVIPRFRGDGGSSIHGVVSNPPKESLEEMQKRIFGESAGA